MILGVASLPEFFLLWSPESREYRVQRYSDLLSITIGVGASGSCRGVHSRPCRSKGGLSWSLKGDVGVCSPRVSPAFGSLDSGISELGVGGVSILLSRGTEAP